MVETRRILTERLHGLYKILRGFTLINSHLVLYHPCLINENRQIDNVIVMF